MTSGWDDDADGLSNLKNTTDPTGDPLATHSSVLLEGHGSVVSPFRLVGELLLLHAVPVLTEVAQAFLLFCFAFFSFPTARCKF